MRFLTLFLAVALFASQPAAAQIAATAATPVDAATSAASAAPAAGSVAVRLATAPDTAQALHRMFAAKRRRRTIIMGGTVAMALVAAGGAVAQGPYPSDGGGLYGAAPSPQNLLAVGIPLVTGTALAIEATTLSGWGHRREREVLVLWQQHQLPLYYKKRLTARFFRPE